MLLYAIQIQDLPRPVAKGKQLVIATSTTEAFRIAGNGKMRRTRRASKADGITACITLAKNRIAATGEETLYVKWIGENGKPVDAPEQNQALVGGEQSGFNGKAVVKFPRGSDRSMYRREACHRCAGKIGIRHLYPCHYDRFLFSWNRCC
jgi:hypothetical protein